LWRVGRLSGRLRGVNEDDLNDMEPLAWYRRGPWPLAIGIAVLLVLAQVVLRS
jgi:hypothetical protein